VPYPTFPLPSHPPSHWIEKWKNEDLPSSLLTEYEELVNHMKEEGYDCENEMVGGDHITLTNISSSSDHHNSSSYMRGGMLTEKGKQKN